MFSILECINSNPSFYYYFFVFNSVATNQDVFNRLMVSSDPLISSMGKIPKRKTIPFRQDVLKFLKEPAIEYNEMSYSSNDEDCGDNDELSL